MARGSRGATPRAASSSRSIKGGPKLTGTLMNHGVVGRGIVGGGSTTMPIPPMGKPLPGGSKPGTRLGAASLRGRR